jgi:DNA-binding response OmpR family regulator
VLLVEDDTAARRALEEFLAEDGHTVLTAGSGPDAERLFRTSRVPIDVVVTDMVLPRMSGPELIRRLRALRPGLKTLFMSGHTPETAHQQGGIGDAAFLQKPFEVGDLLGRIRDLLGSDRPARKARSRAARKPQPGRA